MALGTIIAATIPIILPPIAKAVKGGPEVVDTTPEAPDYVGPDSFEEAFFTSPDPDSDKGKAGTAFKKYALPVGGGAAALLLIWLIIKNNK